MARRGRRMYGKAENQWRCNNPTKIAPVWRPCLPSWEKEFTSKIGDIKWAEFAENKKSIFLYKNVLDWNDTACEEAFTAAKKRFWDHYRGYESEVLLPDPDMHIDKNIDWTSGPDGNKEDEDPMVSISEAEDDFSNSGVMDLPSLGIEQIVPTGWDVDDVPDTADLLTGLVVGLDDDSDDDNVLRDSMNISRELPALRKFRQLRYY
ncbi:hypothetical protein POM88_039893 [Heracleum sosnowskyi]|uniref:Uncharacterized protein n=1 Tax=Heracleum sosnowskyi TaxID=360622 RepID=A0AAD8HDY1_9APIA|nr:hypothetical protein POM88_039893 [Heracleum sosnowskyi]